MTAVIANQGSIGEESGSKSSGLRNSYEGEKERVTSEKKMFSLDSLIK